MESRWQQPSLEMDWNMQQYPAYQFLALANEAPSRVYKRRVSRVTKPSSAGNSPHSLPRRRTMTTHAPDQLWIKPANPEVYSVGNVAMMNTSLQRKSRPTSWHPSSRHVAYNIYTPNCHPSWLNDGQSASFGLQQQDLLGTASINTLSTPITCPVSGDLISNDCFASLDNYNALPMTQTYTPIEPPDVVYADSYDWPSASMEGVSFADQAWTQASDSYLPTDQVADFCQESVSSSDTPTAPPTPQAKSCDPVVYKNHTPAQGDDLVAVGLYDEPEALSLGGGLLGGSFDSFHHVGKGLKLEETFSPAPETDDDDDDAEHEEDQDEDN